VNERPTRGETVPSRLVRQLLARDKAHVQLLAAYRSGSLRAPGKAIDTLSATADVPAQVQALLDSARATTEPTP